MNKVYKVIWNHATQTWVAVSEIAQAKGKTSSKTDKRAKLSKAAAVVSLAVAGSALIGGQAQAATPVTTSASIIEAWGGNVNDNPPRDEKGNPLNANTMALGAGSFVHAAKSIAIGHSAQVLAGGDTSGAESVAIGVNAITRGKQATALGEAAEAAMLSTATGQNAKAVGYASIATGQESNASAAWSTATGVQSKATGSYANALGGQANASSWGSTALGTFTMVNGDEGTAVGYHADVTGRDGTASGAQSVAAEKATATGAQAKAEGNHSTASGFKSNASGENAVAAGVNSTASGESAVAVGRNTTATKAGATAVGNEADATGDFATAMGHESVASGANALALGRGTIADQENSVALGSNSKTTPAIKTENTTLGSFKYNFDGNDVVSTVSVGNDNVKRTITNVAAGRLSETSTDAINGSQLYAVAAALGGEIESTYFHTNDNTNQGAGDPVTNKGRITDKAGATGAFSVTAGVEAKAISQYGIAIGKNSNSTGSAVVIGANAAATGLADDANTPNREDVQQGANGAVVIGENARASAAKGSQPASIAIGQSATAAGVKVSNTTMRNGEEVDLGTAIAIGAKATAKDASVAIGQAADAGLSQFATAVGVNSRALGDRSSAYGVGSVADAQQAVAVGFDSKARANYTTAIGSGSLASQEGATAIGSEATSQSTLAIALGKGSLVHSGADRSMSIGDMSEAHATATIAQGWYAIGKGENGIAIGTAARNYGANSTAVGRGSRSTGASSAAYGHSAYAVSDNATAIGVSSTASGTNGIAIGQSSLAGIAKADVDAFTKAQNDLFTNERNTRVNQGLLVAATAKNDTANITKYQTELNNLAAAKPGLEQALTTAKAKLDTAKADTIAIGTSTKALGTESIAIGKSSNVTGNQSVAVGVGHTIEADNAGAFGDPSHLTADADGSYAIGNNNTITSANTFVLGSGIGRSSTDLAVDSGEGTVANSVYLGNESEVTRGTGSVGGDGVGTLKTWDKDQQSGATATTAGAGGTVSTATVGYLTYGSTSVGGQAFAGATSDGAVSVGSSGAERRIQNVAAGEISKTSTDAINGSQLYAVAHQAAKPITFKANSNKDGANATMNFASENGLERILGDEIVIKGANVGTQLSRNADAATTGNYSARNVQTVVDNQGVQIQIATNPIFDSVQFVSSSGPKITNDGGTNIKVAKPDGSATRITNVANGTEPNDAVNLSQLNATRVSVVAGNNTYVTARPSADGKTYKIDAEKTVVTTGTGLTVSTSGGDSANNVTTYNVALDQETQNKLDRVETVIAGDSGLVTVTSPNNNDTGGKEFKVDITKGAFNGVTTAGKLNADGTTAGVATVADVVTAVNSGFFTVNANGSKAADIKFGDTLNFANGTATTAAVKDGAVVYNTNVDGTTIQIDQATNSLKVNTSALPKTVVAQGNNTVVSSKTDGTTTTYTVDAEKTTVSKAATSPITVTEGIKSATGVTNYEVGLSIDENTLEVVDGKLKSKVVDTDTNTDTSAHVKAADGSLVTVTKADATRADGITQITDYTVDITKGAFNGVTTAGKLNADGTTAGVATVADVVTAVNSGFFTVNANGSKAADIKFGDTLNFANGTGTTAAVKDGAVVYNTNVDGSTIQIDQATNSLKVNTDALPKTVVAAGNNTNVASKTEGSTTTYTIDAEKTVVTTGTGLTVTPSDTGNNVTTYNVALDQATQDQIAKEETVSTGTPDLVTVTTNATKNATGGNDFVVNVTKGTFNNPTSTGELAEGNTGVATVKDVVDAVNKGFLTTKVNGTQVEQVGFGDDINFVDGKGTTARISGQDITYDVNLVSSDNSISITDGTNGAKDLTVNTGTSTVGGDGKAITTDTDEVANLGDVVNAINNVSWSVNSVATGGENTYKVTDTSKISAGDKLNINAGKNIAISGEGDTLNIATSDNVTFNNVTANNFTVNQGGTVNMGGNTVTNVANGTNATDAVNLQQLNATKTAVLAGDNTAVTSAPNATTGGTDYTVHADKTVVAPATGSNITVTPTTTTNANGTETTTYSLDLDQATKAQIAKEETVSTGTPALVTVTTNATKNSTGGNDFVVNVTKGTFNGATTEGALNTAGTKNGVATVADVIEAVNKIGFNVTTGGNKAEGNEEGATLINPGEEITYSAGKNLTVKRVGNEFTFATAENVTFNNVSASNLTVGPVTINQDGINAGDTVITNVASGGDTDTNGANIGDIKRIAAKSVEKVVLDDTVADNIATVNTESGDAAGNAGETYKVGVSKQAVKDAAKEAINVTGTAPIAVTKTDENGVDTYNVTFDGTKAAESIPLTYKANGGNAQTVNLNKGLDFTNGDKTVATVGADGVVTFDLNADAKAQLAKVETVVAGDSGLVTVDNTAQNTSGGKEFKVDIAKGTFNNPSTTGELAAGNTGVATVADVVEAVNKGFLTTKVGGNQVEQVGFGDDINFVNGTGTTARIVDGANGDKGITFDVKTDGTTIKIDDNGNLTVNTDNLPKTKLVDGKNTTVQGDGTEANPYKVDATKTTVTAATGGKVEITGGTEDQNGVINYTVGLDAATKNIIDNAVVDVVDTDTVDLTKTADNKIQADVKTTTLTAVAAGLDKAGQVNAPSADDAKKLVNAQDLATVINNSGWNVKGDVVDGGVAKGTHATTLINPGETVTLRAGKNLALDQATDVFTYSLQDDISLNSVTTVDLTATGATTVNDFTVAPNSAVDMGNNTLTNVGSGGDTDSNGANIGDIKRIAAQSVEKVVLDDTVADNIATVNTQSGKVAGEAGETYKVGVSKAAVKTAAQEAIDVVGDGKAITVTNATANGVETFTVNYNGAEAAKTTPLTYKANGANAQTVNLSEGLNFTNGDKTVATVGADGKVVFDLSDDAKAELAKVETVVAGDSGLVTVDNTAQNTSGGKEFKVDITKGTFNAQTNNGALGDVTNTNGVATVADVVSAVNTGYWTANVDGSTKVADVNFGDSLNFVDGTATDAVLKDGGVSFNVKTDGTTIKVVDGNLTVNTDGLASTEVVSGKNTTVTPTKDGNKTTYKVDATKTTVTAATDGKVEITGGTEDANGVINYTVGLDDATKTVINNAVTEVQDSDSIDFTKTGNTITATVNTGTSTVVAGQAVTTEGNKVATVGDIVKTINNVSWKVASIADGGENSYTTADSSNITAGDTLNIDAGKNIKISGSGNKLNIATKDDVTFNNITTSNLTATGDTVVKNFTIKPNSAVDMGGNTLTNVGSGGDTDSNGANIGDIKRIAAKSVEKVVLDDAVADNIATVSTESGAAAGNAGETYKVGVSKAAVKTAAKEAINVTGTAPIAVTKTDENGVDTYNVTFDGTKAAESIPLTYKANGGNAQTVNLNKGLDFTNGDKTVATVGADGKVVFDLSDAAKEQLAKEESVSTGTPDLLTVTKDKLNDTKGQNYNVDVKKGTFNAQTANGALGDVTNTNGVATVADVVTAVNQGYWTAKVDGNTEAAKVKFGDSLNFVDGVATDAKVGTDGITFDVKTDGTTIKVVDGNLTVNTDGLASTEVVSGKNTTVTPTKDGNKTTYKVDATKTTVTAATDGKVEITGGTEDANGVINYTVGLDDATKTVINNAVTEVQDSDSIDFTKTGNTITATVNTGTSTVVAGQAVTTEGNKVATVGDIVKTINNVSWKVASIADGGENSYTTADSSNITAGDTLNIDAGKNIKISGSGNKLNIATKDDVTFNNITTSNLTATGDTVVKNFTVSPDSVINMGNNQITNVKAGTEDTDAVNVKQLNDTVKAARTKVEAGTNVEVTNVTNDATGEITYTINAKDTTATASVKDGSSEFLTVTANGTKSAVGTTTTDYAVGLTDKAKDVLNNAATKVEDTNTVDLTLTNGVLKADVKAVDGKGTTANVTTNGLTFDIKTDGNTITFDRDGNLTVNTDNLPKTKLVNGKNTTVEGSGTDTDPYKVNVKGDLTDITSISNGDTTIKLGDATVNVGGATITNVANGTKAGDAVNYEQLQASQEEVVSTDKSVTITEGKTEKGAKKFDLSVNTDGTTIVKNADGELSVATTPLTNTATGTVNVPTGDEASKLATAVDIANAINNSGFTIKANGDTGALVKPGDEVDFVNGKNISITRSGTSLTVATVDTPVFTSVQFNENGPIIKADASNNINVGKSDGSATKITNVAAGVDDNDAVNVKQLQDTVAANKTAIKAGNNVDITGEGTTTSPYVINAKDTTATASVKDGSSEFLTVTANGTKSAVGTTTTDYAVGLTDKAKDVLNNAATKVEDTNTVDLTLTNGVLKADVKAVDGKGTTANVTTNGLTFDIKTDGNTITFDRDGNLTVNTDNLPKTKLVNGKNTTVEGSGTDTDPYKVNVKGDLTDITSISNGGTTIKLGDATVNVGGATISNVKAGVEDGDAVNVKQLQDTVAAAKTYVKAGDNTEVTGTGTQADPYTVHAVKTTASAGSDYVTVTPETKANHTTNYSIDLSQDTKDKIEAATKVNNVRETVVAGSDNVVVKTDKTNATGGKEFSVDIAKDITVDSVTANTVNVGPVTMTGNTAEDGVSELSVGSPTAPSRITNVAPGVKGTDAVNVNQLQGAVTNINNRINGLEDDMEGGMAGARAVAALPQVHRPGSSMLAVGLGSYGDKGAVAVGFSSLSDNGRLTFKANVDANTENKFGAGVGMGWEW
ncbi:YadA-like family protein [Moraxella sp. FZLJ2107]|uniref:ESPR-type extended signal peptide-containing protein n=1 Tax=Moraxella sp. FZLJ2107 TaxID=2961618 RepID=UPI0020C91690|nr:ESPR-type extended signal peptide-containing protein [Moraxella sp. FZLJ2107]UTO05265.1 YadA-like family protein [Moraxella sp. FZLJ2107]